MGVVLRFLYLASLSVDDMAERRWLAGTADWENRVDVMESQGIPVRNASTDVESKRRRGYSDVGFIHPGIDI